MKKNLTIKEFATLISEEYVVAASLMKFLVKTGVAKEVGKQKNPEGVRGKPSVIYEVPNDAALVFFDEEEAKQNAEEGAEFVETEQVSDIENEQAPASVPTDEVVMTAAS